MISAPNAKLPLPTCIGVFGLEALREGLKEETRDCRLIGSEVAAPSHVAEVRKTRIMLVTSMRERVRCQAWRDLGCIGARPGALVHGIIMRPRNPAEVLEHVPGLSRWV